MALKGMGMEGRWVYCVCACTRHLGARSINKDHELAEFELLVLQSPSFIPLRSCFDFREGFLLMSSFLVFPRLCLRLVFPQVVATTVSQSGKGGQLSYSDGFGPQDGACSVESITVATFP